MNPTNRDVEAVADGASGTFGDGNSDEGESNQPRPASAAASRAATPTAAPTLTEIAEREAEFLWVTLQRLGVRPADCRDVMQDVLMVVHRKLHTFDGRSPLRAWLYGICVGEASNHRKRAWVRRERPVEPATMAQHAESTPSGADPEGALSARQQQARLEAMLDELDPEKRAVLVMYEIEEMPCEQIAALHGVPVGTVHSRLHAARKAFRAVLARWNLRGASGGTGGRR